MERNLFKLVTEIVTQCKVSFRIYALKNMKLKPYVEKRRKNTFTWQKVNAEGKNGVRLKLL